MAVGGAWLRRLALAVGLLTAGVATAGCERTASEPSGGAAPGRAERATATAPPALKGTLPKPDNLPHLDPTPVVWSVARRAKMQHEDGLKALKSGDLAGALSGLAGAVQLDPGRTSAHLDLARLYARAGQPNVAKGILRQLGTDLGTCGGCVEALQAAERDAVLKPLLSGDLGKKIRAGLKANPLAWEEWALQVSESFRDGTGRLLPGFVHPRVPFTLVRSCPTCSNPEKRQPERRQLFGPRVAVKLATRFNTKEKRYGGVPLTVQGKGTWAGRCVTWQTPSPVPVGTAALARLCFRPISRDRAALTEITVIYGRSKADLKRTP